MSETSARPADKQAAAFKLKCDSVVNASHHNKAVTDHSHFTLCEDVNVCYFRLLKQKLLLSSILKISPFRQLAKLSSSLMFHKHL